MGSGVPPPSVLLEEQEENLEIEEEERVLEWEKTRIARRTDMAGLVSASQSNNNEDSSGEKEDKEPTSSAKANKKRHRAKDKARTETANTGIVHHNEGYEQQGPGQVAKRARTSLETWLGQEIATTNARMAGQRPGQGTTDAAGGGGGADPPFGNRKGASPAAGPSANNINDNERDRRGSQSKISMEKHKPGLETRHATGGGGENEHPGSRAPPVAAPKG